MTGSDLVPLRVPDGTPGIRDVDHPCTVFKPGKPGGGVCMTDGHYICVECQHMSEEAMDERGIVAEPGYFL